MLTFCVLIFPAKKKTYIISLWQLVTSLSRDNRLYAGLHETITKTAFKAV